MQTQVVAVDCEMVGVIDHTQINAKGRPKMISALGKDYESNECGYHK